MLSERAQILLKTLVERYIADGQPVGSRALSKYSGLDLSPASIRNIMADLEDMGFVASPHTSAGPGADAARLPFLRRLSAHRQDRWTAAEIDQLEGQLQQDNTQKLVQSASHILSDLTRFAGVVMTPRRKTVSFRHIEFLRLSDKRLLLIMVTPEGDVQNRIIFTERAYTPSELTEAANFLNQNCAGLNVRADQRPPARGAAPLARRHDAAADARGRGRAARPMTEPADDYVLSGEHNLLHVQDLSSNMASLRRLFDLLEQRTSLLQLLEMGSRAQGVQIYIGAESGLVPLDECSVVTAPYELNGEVVGTVGVIGPTRMAYERIIPIVEITARLLSSAMAQRAKAIE